MSYFPKNYQESRSRFQKMATGVSAPKEIGFWKVPSKKDPDLQVDYVYLPALKTPKNLYLIFSGVHGIEAYTGSALSAQFMEKELPNLNREQTGILLVHSLNPYGFKYHQRCTENQVNLNRNCSASPDLYKMKNPTSIELSTKFIPSTPLTDRPAPLLRQMRKDQGQVYFGDILMDDFIKGVGPGQYESVFGLEYGGTGPEPQIAELTKLLQKIMPAYKDILLFDVHTGLGDRGRLHLLTGDPKICINPSLLREILDPEIDSEIYDFTDNDADGFYETFGATNDLVAELTGPLQRVCALTLEFGTLGHTFENQIDSLDRWLLEHQVTHFGGSEQIRKEIEELNLEKFFPADPDWQRTVLETGQKFFSRLNSRLKIQK